MPASFLDLTPRQRHSWGLLDGTDHLGLSRPQHRSRYKRNIVPRQGNHRHPHQGRNRARRTQLPKHIPGLRAEAVRSLASRLPVVHHPLQLRSRRHRWQGRSCNRRLSRTILRMPQSERPESGYPERWELRLSMRPQLQSLGRLLHPRTSAFRFALYPPIGVIETTSSLRPPQRPRIETVVAHRGLGFPLPFHRFW